MSKTNKQQLKVLDTDPKFLFINENGKWATVVDISFLIESGTPLVPESGDDGDCDDFEEEATYVGVVDPNTPIGDLDLRKYLLPPEALQIVDNNREHRKEFSGPK